MSAGTAPALRPASTPQVLRLAPAPCTDPPAQGPDWTYPGRGGGGERHAAPGGESSGRATGYVQGSLAVDFRDDAYDTFFGPQATGTADLPEAQGWARRMIQAALEACDGTRRPEQLSRWMSADVLESVARRGLLARRRGRRPHRAPVVRTVRTCHPADGVCEVAAVVHTAGRVRALALRMSGVDGRWLITAFELG